MAGIALQMRSAVLVQAADSKRPWPHEYGTEQVMHLSWPVALWYSPLGQLAHAVLAAAELNVPTAHGTQFADQGDDAGGGDSFEVAEMAQVGRALAALR